MSEMEKSSIHVSLRCRPLSTEDDAKRSPWKISSNSISTPSQPSHSFKFDRIFREDCKTVQVYEARTKDIVAAAVRGFNGTVFAYGQTNSGKTHTMRGSPTEPGVIPLAVHDLFQTIYQDASREFLLRMSYLEIYNEEINDLLAHEHSSKLQIHENQEKGIYVAGLREEIVASPQQVLDMMEIGESHRHIGETNMNVHSSRSHTIFRMIIESSQKTQDEGVGNACDAVRVSVLNLVDLAGSERASKTGAKGVRLKEGSHINKSLMTLGTVIKKLSEGVENQGGHVPYRDSKLTRILQPALGGNANTAIICNITLEPIHADETKSSLQFASRALRVTNCAHVNEVSTDAALLKRQKKEIEELRSKPQTSHSDHSDEEILNLRNTLLKTELERERIAMELNEEKKAQAQRDIVLQAQAKKIENLSSMVLFSNRDEKREQDQFKKGKRRDTWGTGHLSRDSTSEVQSHGLSGGSFLKSERSECETGTLHPFAELVKKERLCSISEQDENCMDETLEDSALPDPCALVNVTCRKKPSKIIQKKPVVVESESDRIQKEYEDLFLQYETERITNEIQIECLKAKLGENDLSGEATCTHLDCNVHRDESSVHLRDPEDILLIKQLQEKINMLESEKSSSKQTLDDLVMIATEQNTCAREKIAEIQGEIHAAREEAQIAREQLVSKESEVNHVLNNVATEVELLASEFQKFKASLDEGLQDFAFFSPLIHILSKHHETETSDLLSHIECLEKDIASLSTSSLAKEKEFEKTKTKLKDTESKLENAMHDKTKLEAEKASAERELERLHSQMAVLKNQSLQHLATSLSEIEEEKAIWSPTEKTLTDAMEEKMRLSNIKIEPLSPKETAEAKQRRRLWTPLKDQRRILWTLEEEKMLKMGVDKFGTKTRKNMPWKKILAMGEYVFHKTRNPSDLKDKWKRMSSKTLVT